MSDPRTPPNTPNQPHGGALDRLARARASSSPLSVRQALHAMTDASALASPSTTKSAYGSPAQARAAHERRQSLSPGSRAAMLGTFASSALSQEEWARDASTFAAPASVYKPPPTTPRGEAYTPSRRAKTPMSKHVSAIVDGALSALKASRARMEELVQSHKGSALNFTDVVDVEKASVTVELPSASLTVSHSRSAEDREAQREVTEMLLRSAQKVTPPKKKTTSYSPLRSPAPLEMVRVEPGRAMPILADSQATDALNNNSNNGDDDNKQNDDEDGDEVTSQVSLPIGFDVSEYMQNVEPSTTATVVDKEVLEEETMNEDNEPENVADAFARMMGKVISDTLRDIQSASAAFMSEPLTEILVQEETKPEPTTPRRSSRRKSVGADAAPVTPVTPSRRSKRLASKNNDAAD